MERRTAWTAFWRTSTGVEPCPAARTADAAARRRAASTTGEAEESDTVYILAK